MNYIDRLNQNFGEALGFANNQPRFAWRWAPDLFRYSRNSVTEPWEEKCWAEQLGRVWVLTMLRAPVGIMYNTEVPITREDWWHAFRGLQPYPSKLTPYVFAETALIEGLEPDQRRTQFYINSLREQMAVSRAQKIRDSEAQAKAVQDEYRKQFMLESEEWWPAFWSSNGGAHTPGTRGGHVAFQR
jgi:hypothetical protein